MNCLNESPELKYAKRRLYENLIMANLTKTYVLFKTSFWLEEGFSGEVVSNGGPSLVESCEKGPVVIFFDATTRIGTPALVGFIGGKAADQWNSKVSFEMGLGKEIGDEEPYNSTKISIFSFICAGLAALHKASTI